MEGEGETAGIEWGKIRVGGQEGLSLPDPFRSLVRGLVRLVALRLAGRGVLSGGGEASRNGVSQMIYGGK